MKDDLRKQTNCDKIIGHVDNCDQYIVEIKNDPALLKLMPLLQTYHDGIKDLYKDLNKRIEEPTKKKKMFDDDDITEYNSLLNKLEDEYNEKPAIGVPVDMPKKKQGFFQKLFQSSDSSSDDAVKSHLLKHIGIVNRNEAVKLSISKDIDIWTEVQVNSASAKDMFKYAVDFFKVSIAAYHGIIERMYQRGIRPNGILLFGLKMWFKQCKKLPAVLKSEIQPTIDAIDGLFKNIDKM